MKNAKYPFVTFMGDDKTWVRITGLRVDVPVRPEDLPNGFFAYDICRAPNSSQRVLKPFGSENRVSSIITREVVDVTSHDLYTDRIGFGYWGILSFEEFAAMSNTLVEYQYRSGNYKMQLSAIVSGHLTFAEKKKIYDAVGRDGFFYPGNIKLPADTFASEGFKPGEDDPTWHEILSIRDCARTPTICNTSAAELLAAFCNGTAMTYKTKED